MDYSEVSRTESSEENSMTTATKQVKFQQETIRQIEDRLFHVAVLIDRLPLSSIADMAQNDEAQQISHWLYQITESLKARGITAKE